MPSPHAGETPASRYMRSPWTSVEWDKLFDTRKICGFTLKTTDSPPQPRVEGPGHSREAASDVAQGDPYSASPGNKALFTPTSCLTPLAEGARHMKSASNSDKQGNMRVTRSRLHATTQLRPVASGTMKIQKNARNPGLASTLALGYIRRRFAAVCRHSDTRPGRRIHSSPTPIRTRTLL